MLNLWIWLGITVVSLVLEFITMEMVSIWFVLGGVVAMILSAIHVDLVWQIVAFIVVSVILILCCRRVALKLIGKGDNTKTNAESDLGKAFKLLTAITRDQKGTIKINGVVWNVSAENDEEIAEGEVVELLRLEGNKYIVSKKQNNKTEEIKENNLWVH